MDSLTAPYQALLPMSVSHPLTGIFCPTLIPFDAAGKINERELRRLVSWLIDRGIHGLYPNGSTGEFIRLTFAERLRVVEVICDEAAGRVPVLAGAAEGNLELSLEAAAHYHQLGCCAISATGPYYYKVAPESVEAFFRELAKESPIDILLYNIPQFANEIPVSTIQRLALELPNVIGVKDSSRDMPRFLNTLQAVKPHRPDFTVFSGCEEILFPCLMMGADGGTLASSGVIPEAIVGIYEAFRKDDWSTCRQLQFKVLELIEAMLKAGNFPDGFRAGAALRGFEMGRSRQPLGPNDEAARAKMQEHIACILSDCGYQEAASACRRRPESAQPSLQRLEVERLVREVISGLSG